MSVSGKNKKMKKILAHNWRWMAMVALSTAAVMLVALPARKAADHDQRIVQALRIEIDGMASWAMDGTTIEQMVSTRSLSAAEDWCRLFPEAKGKEVLFLDLARIADACGVREFYLAEAEDRMKVQASGSSMGPGPGDAPAGDGIEAVPTVSLALSSFKVRTRFEADLQGTALFLDELDSIERALEIREISIRESRNGLVVEMEMELYVSEQNQS